VAAVGGYSQVTDDLPMIDDMIFSQACLSCDLGWSHHPSSRQSDGETHIDVAKPAAGQKSVSTINADPADPPPTRPVEPDADDCCGEGCARCVFDAYGEALERYEAALAAWHARHT
jgi:hypothetical protein